MTGEEQRPARCGRKAIEPAKEPKVRAREGGKASRGWDGERELPGEVGIAERQKHDGGGARTVNDDEIRGKREGLRGGGRKKRGQREEKWKRERDRESEIRRSKSTETLGTDKRPGKTLKRTKADDDLFDENADQTLDCYSRGETNVSGHAPIRV